MPTIKTIPVSDFFLPSGIPPAGASDTLYLFKGVGAPLSNDARWAAYTGLTSPGNPCDLNSPFTATRAGFKVLADVDNNDYGIRHIGSVSTLGDLTLNNGANTPTGDYKMIYRTNLCDPYLSCTDVETLSFVHIEEVACTIPPAVALCVSESGIATPTLGGTIGAPTAGIDITNLNTTTIYQGVNTAHALKTDLLIMLYFYTPISSTAPSAYCILTENSSTAAIQTGTIDINTIFSNANNYATLEYNVSPSSNTQYGASKAIKIFSNTANVNDYPQTNGLYTITDLNVLGNTATYEVKIFTRNQYHISNSGPHSNSYQEFTSSARANLTILPNAGIAGPALTVCN